MNWTNRIENSIEYIEKNLTNNLDYETIAAQSFSSSYHFQRVFGILSGITLGEYIRKRRLTLAGNELTKGNVKVIDIALKYGYESPDSFTKAFMKFHGITPSEARKPGSVLRSFARLSLDFEQKENSEMKYRIEEKPGLILTGYKSHFTGVPYGENRAEQEENMYVTTRAKQWLLNGAAVNYENEYCVVKNIDDQGYDFYIAQELDQWTHTNLYNKEITGVDFMEDMGFENITIPSRTYAIFETKRTKKPMDSYIDIRNRIMSQWLPDSGYRLANSPELVVLHWRPADKENDRYIEIRLPVEKI